jgi:hypothetical protein
VIYGGERHPFLYADKCAGMTTAAMAWSNSRPFLCAGMCAGRWQVRQHELCGVFLKLA